MPPCPHCQTEYQVGQRYCQVCGSYLLHPETGDSFCPQCGIRVSKRQEFCHECDAPLKGEAAAAPAPEGQAAPTAAAEAAPAAAPAPPAAPAKGLQPWVVGLLIAAGVIILLLLVLVFTRTEKPAPLPAPPPPKTEAPAPPAAPPAPAAKAPAPATTAPPPAPPAQPASLKEQLQGVLAKMREARMKADIILLMSCYSLTFPDLEEKRSEALKSWEDYNYTNMVFTLDEVQPLDADNANAKVTWYVDLKNRNTGELISATQTFKVRFAKELGHWRIRSLEEIE